jgi:hypothetical protein
LRPRCCSFSSIFTLPLVIVKLVLLEAGRLSPSVLHVPGLLFNLLLLTAALVMPLFAVATVTANFARMALIVVGRHPRLCCRLGDF